jgi:hypothetical protein
MISPTLLSSLIDIVIVSEPCCVIAMYQSLPKKTSLTEYEEQPPISPSAICCCIIIGQTETRQMQRAWNIEDERAALRMFNGANLSVLQELCVA